MNEERNIETLKETLLQIRKEHYPDVPVELVNQIVDLQAADRMNTTDTINQIRDLVIKYTGND